MHCMYVILKTSLHANKSDLNCMFTSVLLYVLDCLVCSAVEGTLVLFYANVVLRRREMLPPSCENKYFRQTAKSSMEEAELAGRAASPRRSEM